MIRIFNVSIPTNLLILLAGDIAVAIGCYVLAGAFALNASLDLWFYLQYENGWAQIGLVTGVLLLAFYFLDFYTLTKESRAHMIQQLCVALGVSFMVQALVGYSESTALQLPQWTMVYGSVFLLVAFPGWRSLFFDFMGKRLPTQRVLLMGISEPVLDLARILNETPTLGISWVGYVGEPVEGLQIPHLGRVSEIATLARQLSVDRIVVSRSDAEPLPTQVLLDLRMGGTQVDEIGTLYEEITGRVSLRTLRPEQLIFAKELRPRPWTLRFQSLYSWLGSLIGLVILAPVMVLVAIAVRLTSAGPAIYSQERAGYNGRPFRLFKFRSMYVDAEKRTGPVWATKNDPRITPLGRWLRKLRLDELPQLFNVLAGQMSLVGPRPERPEFCKLLEEKIPYFHQRHSVKPGITGWAQINHRYADTIEDTVAKLEYDLYYVKNLSPTLDAYVIFHTIKVMLLFRGAQ